MSALKFDPSSELMFRIRLAQEYLREAEEAFSRGDWRTAVASSQLSAENSAKAVIAYFRVPSWSHDPSPELMDVIGSIPGDVRNLVEELAEVVRRLAPEHGRSTYGEPLRGLTPWDIYSAVEAEEALDMARKALGNARVILRRLGVKVSSSEGAV